MSDEQSQELPTVGDVVRLRSGGPPMTIIRVGKKKLITTAWIGNRPEVPYIGCFPLAALDVASRHGS